MTEKPADAHADDHRDQRETANDDDSPAEQAKTREREMEESGEENAA